MCLFFVDFCSFLCVCLSGCVVVCFRIASVCVFDSLFVNSCCVTCVVFFFCYCIVETVLAMLRTEDRLRKSDEMQELYDRTRHLAGDQVERFIQR